MRYEDSLFVGTAEGSGYDSAGYAVAPAVSWTMFNKCFLSFNGSARRTNLADGKEYHYSYYVIVPLKKALYSLIPKEGERVRVVKADNSVDKILEVKGFVTYKKRFLKIWLSEPK